MGCFDLAELDELVGPGGMLSKNRWRAISFPDGKHLRDFTGTLDQRVRTFMEMRTGTRPNGAIRLLTQLRYFGYYFSPLNFFFIDDEKETAGPPKIVAEVNNTPWGEQHLYFLQPTWDESLSAWTFQHAKQMHVSPFMPMDQTYRWTFKSLDDQLAVELENIDHGQAIFKAGMNLAKKPLATSTLRRFFYRMPAMSLKVVAAIYLEAWKLWWKRCPVYPHPHRRSECSPPVPASDPRLPR